MYVTLTMETVVSAFGILAGVAGSLATWRARRIIPGTTLRTSYRWSLAAAVTLCGAWVFSRAAPDRRNWVELFWYVSVLVTLCPPIAVLGARRPGVRAWNWFVLWPLLAVMGWPAVTVFGADGHLGRLQLETPALVGFLLVLVMGYGNYLGTRASGTALLLVVGSSLILAPVSTSFGDWGAGSVARTIGYLCCTVAPWTASRAPRVPEPPGFTRLWQDFRNTFGIVWAHRVAERFNQQMLQEGCQACLSPRGFQWRSGPDARTLSRAEHNLRWLLRRFVDSEWIDARLGSTAGREPD